jgi:AcrR family transcriptional regulator
MEIVSICQRRIVPAPKALRADARRNRDALIAAARSAFERGEFDLRFDDFAALAGVGVGTLYRHFPTREALAEAVYRGEVRDLATHAETLRAELPAGEALRAFLRELVSRLVEREALARTLATLMATNAPIQAEGGRELERVLVALVDAAVREGRLDARVGVGGVLMLLHGICAHVGLPGWRADAEALIDLLVAPARSAP